MRKEVYIGCIIIGSGFTGYLFGAGLIQFGGQTRNDQNPEKPDIQFVLPDSEDIEAVNINNIPKSIVWTNLGTTGFEELDNVRAISIDEPIYDIGFSFYSDWYAKRYGFPKSHVRKLPEHVQFMEYRMKTLGGMKNCYLNMLLDKGLDLNVPDHPFSPMLILGNLDAVPLVRPSRVQGWTESERIREFRMKWKGLGADQGSNNKYIFRNAFITSVPYSPSFGNKKSGKEKKPGKLLGVVFHSYSPWFYEGLDYVSISLTCSPLTQVFHEQPAFFLWLKKKDGKDYTRHLNPEREDFLVFEVPMELRQKILPFMKTGRSDGNSLYKRGIENIKPSQSMHKEKGN